MNDRRIKEETNIGRMEKRIMDYGENGYTDGNQF